MTDEKTTITIRQSGARQSTNGFDVRDRGLLLADGVFDTSLVVGGVIAFRELHFDRLVRDCEALGIKVDRTEIESIAEETIPDGKDGALRITVTRGPGTRGLAIPDDDAEPTLVARFDEKPCSYPAPAISLRSSGILRNPSAPSSRHKTLAYTDTIIGLDRARKAGFDDALYMTPDGHAACTSMANIFARFGTTLVTPPLSDGVLDGVMRRWLVEAAPGAGFDVDITSLNIASLARADALYTTNSLQLIRAAKQLDEIPLDPALPPALDALCKHVLSPG